MVSKFLPPKSPPTKLHRNPSLSHSHSQRRRHHRRHHHHHKSSLTNNNLLSSLNKSLSSFYRRFLKFFQTPKTHPNSNNFFQFLFSQKNDISIPVPTAPSNPIKTSISRSRRSTPSLLPPIKPHHQTTIILDLDETLVHSSHNPPPHQPFDFIIHPIIDEEVTSYHVLKRPGLETFLTKLSSIDQIEIVVFTAGLREYASLVLDEIDKDRVISHRLFRDSCKEVDGKLVKDLRDLGRDLGRVVIIDDNPNAYAFQPENAIPVRPFVEDLEDVELMKMMRFFDECLRFGDTRDAVKVFLDDEEHKLMKKLGL